MNFLIGQTITLIISVASMWYLMAKDYFIPWNIDGTINWYYVFILGLLLFIGVQALASIASLLIKKRLAFGKKEFPPTIPCLMDGLVFALSVVGILTLHIFHILSLGWSIIIFMIVAVIIVLMK